MVNDKGTDVDKCEKKVMKESKVAGEIKALVDTKEFNKSSDKERERDSSRIRGIYMDNLGANLSKEK